METNYKITMNADAENSSIFRQHASLDGSFLLHEHDFDMPTSRLPAHLRLPTSELIEALRCVYAYLFEAWYHPDGERLTIRLFGPDQKDIRRITIDPSGRNLQVDNVTYRSFYVTTVTPKRWSCSGINLRWSGVMQSIVTAAGKLATWLVLNEIPGTNEELSRQLYASIREDVVYRVPYEVGQDPLHDVFLQTEDLDQFSVTVDDREVVRDPEDPNQEEIVDA